ncbi:hypothetical protein H2204_002775 [Knufia peltigerae]|uniref:Xylanolytic transcriptional activator regulatory domain-containing protein n=1 Tax=Knufia peltigerae TaxID=1002370 RepID=A0AA38YAP0_9EURO|nr:hypothetical protein H2204_002775 [Knufia peltigerae]
MVGIRECVQTLQSMLRQSSNHEYQLDSSEKDPPSGTGNNREYRGTKVLGHYGSSDLSSSRQQQVQALSRSNQLPASAGCQLVVSAQAPATVVQPSPTLDTQSRYATSLMDMAALESPAMPFPLSIDSNTLEYNNTAGRDGPEEEEEEKEEEEKPRFHLDPERRQVSYYGPTSQNYHSSPCADRNIQGQPCTIDPLESVDMDIDLDSPHIKRVIMDCFWKSNEVFGRAVDRDLFMASQKTGDASEYYSKALEDVILACGARNSTSAVIRSLGHRYVKRAKAGLLMQLESPTVGSILGFMLLSNFDSSMGSHRVGWTYGGIGFLLLVDLGLHEDCSDLVTQGKLTEAEASCRKDLLYSAFIYETVGAWFLGRPRQIPISAVSLNFPSREIYDPANTSTVVFYSWVQLCIQMAFVADIVNDALPLDDQAIQQLSQLCANIQSFQDSLPPGVKWEGSTMSPLDSSAYSLNTQAAALQIIIHQIPTRCRRPAKRGLNDNNNNTNPPRVQSPSATLSGFEPELSQRICYDNAVRIAQLVRMSVEIHGVENMSPTMLDNMFVAAMVLIRRNLDSTELHQDWWLDKDRQWLVVLSEALDAVQKHFPMAYRIRFRLSRAVENTPMDDIFNLEKAVGENWARDELGSLAAAPFRALNSNDDILMGDFLMDSTVQF